LYPEKVEESTLGPNLHQNQTLDWAINFHLLSYSLGFGSAVAMMATIMCFMKLIFLCKKKMEKRKEEKEKKNEGEFIEDDICIQPPLMPATITPPLPTV
jgi:ascorbate-specific PTS system EIIC-type component UlaA